MPTEGRKWNDILANSNVKGITFESAVSKLVMKLVRHYDQEEREADGDVHWKSMAPKLRHAFQREGGHTLFRLASSSAYLQKEQQDQVPMLQKILRRSVLYSRYSRTHW